MRGRGCPGGVLMHPVLHCGPVMLLAQAVGHEPLEPTLWVAFLKRVEAERT